MLAAVVALGLRAVYRCRDLAVLGGQLRQAYLVAWRALPSPYDAVASDDDASDVDVTYGEAFVVVARDVLRDHGCGAGSVVVDLGCGRGNVLLAARSLGADARGVDVVASHVEACGRALAVVGAEVVVGDARDADVDDATHVWLSWGTWPAAVRRAVVERLHALRDGAIVVGVIEGVSDEEGSVPGFVVVERRREAFSWGWADVVVSRRIARPPVSV